MVMTFFQLHSSAIAISDACHPQNMRLGKILTVPERAWPDPDETGIR